MAVLFGGLALAMLASARVSAATSASDCAAIAQLVDGQVAISTTGDIPLKQSWDGLSTVLDKTKTACAKSDPNRHFILAMLMIWTGWLVHYERHDDTDLEQGIQLLTKCESEYFGEHEGAVCAQWQGKAIHWKTQWEEDASP